MSKYKDSWKRNKNTIETVNTIREKVIIFEFDEELAIVPLLKVFSVLVRKGDDCFNIRLDKDTLKLTSCEKLKYFVKQDVIKKIVRH